MSFENWRNSNEYVVSKIKLLLSALKTSTQKIILLKTNTVSLIRINKQLYSFTWCFERSRFFWYFVNNFSQQN